MRNLVAPSLALSLLTGCSALLAPIVVRPVALRCRAPQLSVRTPEQLAAYSGAKDTPSALEAVTAKLTDPKVLKSISVAAAVAVFAVAYRARIPCTHTRARAQGACWRLTF